MDTLLDWVGASYLTARPRIKTDVVATEGHVYVLGYNDGMVKVGQSRQPADRILEHAKQAKRHGSDIVRIWISTPHLEWVLRERDLKRICRNRGQAHAGYEYFSGVEVDQLITTAQSLRGTRSTASHAQRTQVVEPSQVQIMDAIKSRRLIVITPKRWEELANLSTQAAEAVGLVRALLGSRPPGDLLDALRDAVTRLETDPIEFVEWRYMHSRVLDLSAGVPEYDDAIGDAIDKIFAGVEQLNAPEQTA